MGEVIALHADQSYIANGTYPMRISIVISMLIIGLLISIASVMHDCWAGPFGSQHGMAHGVLPTDSSAAVNSPPVPECRIAGKGEISIVCNYQSIPQSRLENKKAPCIALNRIVLSFKTGHDSRMHVNLTFTNEGVTRISDARPVYLAIDDERGRNHLRRVLPHTDLTAIKPGQTLTFQNTLIAPAFSQGHYTIFLWIPASDSSLKFDSAHNLLLHNKDVANPETGLNSLAAFEVLR
jgi:hypothetical protein